jgi:hypothetical protein
METGGYSRMHIITNDWHMKRSRAIFSYIFSMPLCDSVACKFWKKHYHLEFIAASSGIDDAEALHQRQKREEESLQSFQSKTMKEFTSLESMHHWLFSAHDAYSTRRFGKKPITSSDLKSDLLKTY